MKKLTTACPCLYVADEDNSSVTVYAEGATGNATPIQTISGSYTGLSSPNDVASDTSRDIYVANDGNSSATVYSAGATGNVAPIQTITGSMTGLYYPDGIALNPLNGNIYVANPFYGRLRGGAVTGCFTHQVRAATSRQSVSSKASARDSMCPADSCWVEAAKSTFRTLTMTL